MKSFRLGLFAVASVLLGVDATGQGGELLVSGDVTPVFSLTNASPNPATPGNRQFFTNILQGGTNVAIRNTSFNSSAGPEINQFYASLGGVASTLITGPVTTNQLASVDLFVAPVPDTAFSASEGNAIAGFLNSGGVVLLIGESEGIPFGLTTNGYVNNLLAQLGSQLTLVDRSLDIGPQIATGSMIAVHPLTAGVAAFNYGSASEVVGGAPLFFAQNGPAFVAVETQNIPEPAAMAMLALGLASYAWRRAASAGRWQVTRESVDRT